MYTDVWKLHTSSSSSIGNNISQNLNFNLNFWSDLHVLNASCVFVITCAHTLTHTHTYTEIYRYTHMHISCKLMLLLANMKRDLVIWLRKIAAIGAFWLLSVLLYSCPTMKIYKCNTLPSSHTTSCCHAHQRHHLAELIFSVRFSSVKYSVCHNSHKLG